MPFLLPSPSSLLKLPFVECPPGLKDSAVRTELALAIDCKTVGFFLRISKEIGKAWRKSLARAKRASLLASSQARRACVARGFLASLPSLALCFQHRTGHFVWLLARSWIRKNTDCFAVYSHNKIQFSLHFIKRHYFLISTALPAVQCIHVIPSVLSPGMCWVAGKSIVADLQAHGISSIH